MHYLMLTMGPYCKVVYHNIIYKRFEASKFWWNRLSERNLSGLIKIGYIFKNIMDNRNDNIINMA